MNRMLRTLTLLAATAGAMLALIAPSATASTTVPETPHVVIHDGDLASASAACEITRGGQTGLRICGYAWFDLTWSDGRRHTFVIGMNSSVYNIVEYAGGGTSGWRSLGGQAIDGVYLNYVFSQSELGIWVTGLDGRAWCRDLSGSWNAWHAAGC